MAFHQIQCPHCFTDYTITDEQYRNTEGVVRCGTCREQFKAILVTEDGTPPKFDPRDVFIEPLSEPLAAAEGGDKKLTGEPDASYVSYEKEPDAAEDSNIELMSTHEFDYTGPPEPIVPQDIAAEYGDSDELSTSEILRNLRRRQLESGGELTQGENDGQSDNPNYQQAQLNFDTKESRQPDQQATDRASAGIDQASDQQDAALIDKVDELVERKLVHAPLATAKTDNDFFLEPRRQRKSSKSGAVRFLRFLFWGFVAILLTAGLVYQLWLKQIVDLPLEQPWLQKLFAVSSPYLAQAEKKLAEYDVVIPQRRNLSKLELVSAKTEPHPNRTTTVLLKVSILNRADITQPLPWLEMTLMDSEGRLVSRRNLSPLDYIYNNRTNSRIGPNELKKVTIELLAFPKSATGFEIKMLNK